MAGLVLRTLIVALGLWFAAELVPGIVIHGTWTLLGAALVLGIVNAIVRPLLILMTLPITIVSLGLFLLVINAAMFGLTAWLFDDFTLAGFWSALFGSIIVSLTSWLASYFIGPRGRIEVTWVRQAPGARGARHARTRTIEGEYHKLDE
jgi:putative membrane protein